VARAPPGASDQPRAPRGRAARVRRIDGAGRTAEVPEDAGNDRRLLDAGDDALPAAAVVAGVKVDGEHALEALRPGEVPRAVSPVVLSDGSVGWFGLGPISVLPAHQGRGIGSRLMREVLQRLRDSGAAGCVLVGDPRFYQRFKFRSRTTVAYPDVPAEVFLVLAFGPSIPDAVVAFHPAFGARE